jgi:hypothetical protein
MSEKYGIWILQCVLIDEDCESGGNCENCKIPKKHKKEAAEFEAYSFCTKGEAEK